MIEPCPMPSAVPGDGFDGCGIVIDALEQIGDPAPRLATKKIEDHVTGCFWAQLLSVPCVDILPSVGRCSPG